MIDTILKFIKWLAQSFSGNNDVSSRRLTAFAAMVIYTYGRVTFIRNVTDVYYQLLGCFGDAIFVLLLFGIITMQQVIDLKNGKEVKHDN